MRLRGHTLLPATQPFKPLTTPYGVSTPSTGKGPETVTIQRNSLVHLLGLDTPHDRIPAEYRVGVQRNGVLIAHVYGQTKRQTLQTARIVRDTLNRGERI